MSNLVKMQAEQSKNEFTSYTHTIGKGLGASLLCLSVLAGCASNPDQDQPIDSAENTIQTEEVTTPESNSQAEGVDTAKNTSTDNEPQDVTTETASITTETATPETVTTSATTPETTTKTSAMAEEGLATEGEPAAAELSSEQPIPAADTTKTAGALAIGAETTAADEETTGQPLTRSSKNLGKSYGIWTLKDAGNGFCKLKTPTLQIGNKEYSSQIWMDIEEQKIIVNAYMALDIKHPKTGIQIDNQALVPFAEKVNSTRAVVTGDMTAQLSAGKELHIYINGKEVGKKVLKRNVKLTDMNAAISALRSCSNE